MVETWGRIHRAECPSSEAHIHTLAMKEHTCVRAESLVINIEIHDKDAPYNTPKILLQYTHLTVPQEHTHCRGARSCAETQCNQ